MHEFETLIFADLEKLDDEYFDSVSKIRKLKIDLSQIKDQNPELVNDNPSTAPSKRILSAVPDYDKVNVGPGIVASIGIEKLRDSCKHFNSWLQVLENLTLDD